jgi:hypothetical protein
MLLSSIKGARFAQRHAAASIFTSIFTTGTTTSRQRFSVAALLQICCSSVADLLQLCCSSVAALLQLCCSSVASVPGLHSYVLLVYFYYRYDYIAPKVLASHTGMVWRTPPGILYLHIYYYAIFAAILTTTRTFATLLWRTPPGLNICIFTTILF